LTATSNAITLDVQKDIKVAVTEHQAGNNAIDVEIKGGDGKFVNPTNASYFELVNMGATAFTAGLEPAELMVILSLTGGTIGDHANPEVIIKAIAFSPLAVVIPADVTAVGEPN